MPSVKTHYLTLLALALSVTTISAQNAQASRFFAKGKNGAAGAYGTQNQYGGRAGAAAVGTNAGAGIRGSKWAGPNGGTFQSAGGFAYKKGVGAGRRSSWNGSANGNKGSGYTNSQYNAQSGQGTRSSSEQLQNASGKDYGYNGSTNYTKGQGGTSVINTDNKGSYDVNWQKGEMPVVTPVTPAH